MNPACWPSSTGHPRPLRLHRNAAIGDVVMALAVAQQLHSLGYTVRLDCAPACHAAIGNLSWLSRHPSPKERLIELDKAYEKEPREVRKVRPVSHLFAESAWRQLGRPLSPLTTANLTPRLEIQPQEQDQALQVLNSLPRPWLAVIPRSNAWPNRTLSTSVWQRVASQPCDGGVWLWTGTDPAPPGFHDLNCRTHLRWLMACLHTADVVVSVDTGPMHLAAGLGTPLVAIEQCVDPAMRLSDQRDWHAVRPHLECLSCHEWKCPINEAHPPCSTEIDPSLIATETLHKWHAQQGHGVSAIIPIYQPNIERLNRCLAAVLPTVNEAVLAFDGDGRIPAGLLPRPKVKGVQNRRASRQGFGKMCNLAARHSTSPWLLLLNDDCFAQPTTVQRLLDVAIAQPRVALVGCLLRYPNGLIQHGGVQMLGLDGWGHLDHCRPTSTIKDTTPMPGVTFACALLNRQAFYEVGCFDEEYDCYFEDVDLCRRLTLAGWSIYYTPHAQATHDESLTTGPLKAELFKHSREVFRRKWKGRV